MQIHINRLQWFAYWAWMSVFNVSTVSHSASFAVSAAPVVSNRTLNVISLLPAPFLDPLGPDFIKSLLRVTLAREFDEELLRGFSSLTKKGVSAVFEDVDEELFCLTLVVVALEAWLLWRMTPLLGFRGGGTSTASSASSISIVSNPEESCEQIEQKIWDNANCNVEKLIEIKKFTWSISKNPRNLFTGTDGKTGKLRSEGNVWVSCGKTLLTALWKLYKDKPFNL